MTSSFKIVLFFLLSIILFQPNSGFTQISQGGSPLGLQNRSASIGEIPMRSFHSINHDSLRALSLKEEEAGLPPRFGALRATDANLRNSGQWTELANGDRVWELRIKSDGAKSINLLYKEFYMPEGAKFFVYGANNGKVLGAFTNFNNKEDGIFATGLIYDRKLYWNIMNQKKKQILVKFS